MDVRLYLVNVDKDPLEAKRIAADVAKRIEKKDMKLLDVVQSMGEFMTDEDATVRAKSIGYLSSVLAALDPKALTRQHVSVITQFLTDRLQDETGLKEVAQGLLALLNMPRFGSEEAEVVTTGLVKVELRKHPQRTRFTVLTVLDKLMANHRNVLKRLGDEFTDGFLELVGGEKDPRNLMIVFSILKVIIIEFDIDRYVEAMFDAAYVYYPITFTPPPNDPYGITSQDLKLRLRDCLSATGRFAEHVYKPLIEKLDSTSPSVKKDVLQTMAACALNYGPTVMSKYSTSLWDAVKFEVLNASSPDDEIAEEALVTIRAIATGLAYGVTNIPPPASALSIYLKEIVKECAEPLKEPQQKQAKPAGQILASVAKAGPVPHAYIIKNTLPDILTVYDESEGINKQRAMLEISNQIFKATASVYGEWGDLVPEPALENPLLAFKDRLFDIYSKALMGTIKDEVGFRIVALQGLAILSSIRRLFADNEVGMVVQYFDEVVLENGQEAREDIKAEALEHLLKISKMKPNLIMEITFPALMATLPDSEQDAAGKPYIITLEALAKLSIERAVFEVLLTRLLNKLDVVIQNGSSPTYPQTILSTILYVLQKKSDAGHEDIPTFYERLVPPLITRIVMGLVVPPPESQCKKGGSVLADGSVLEIIGRIMKLIVRSLDAVKQEEVLRDAFDLFIHHKPSNLIQKRAEVAGDIIQEFRPFGSDVIPKHASCITLFTCIIAGVRKEIHFPHPHLPTFLSIVHTSILNHHTPIERLALLRLLAIVVNKWLPPCNPSHPSDETASIITTLTDTSSSDAIRATFWLAKSLSMKSDPSSTTIITTVLLPLLSDSNHGSLAARGFAVLLGEDEFLNNQNYAVQRLLSKQKVFSLCVPMIVEGLKKARAEEGIKPNYLVALSNILRHIPSKIFLPELPTLVPLLLQTLDLPFSSSSPSPATSLQDVQNTIDVKLATLSTLSITILESANALQEHVSSLITRLLTASIFTQEGDACPPPKVRMAALRCLRIFPGTLENVLLLPYKRQVTRGLLRCLDDPKRRVRKEAVDCRARWLALDEPVED